MFLQQTNAIQYYVDKKKIILVEIMAKYLKCTYLCPILVAFPAAPYLLQATWEMCVSGAAILMTAAALLSCKDEDAKKVMHCPRGD
jgi:hypothetical protein